MPPTGNSERFFLSVLERHFPSKVFTRRYINCPPTSDRHYTPDFTLIEPEYRLFLDIEIDEPYSYGQGKPTHFEGDDDERNQYISERYGWVVVRFTEEQVIRQPERCCKTVVQVLAAITLDNSRLEPFAGVPDLTPEPQWTEGQANAKAVAKYRDTYAHLLPQAKREVPAREKQVQPKKEFKPSEYQLAIFDFIENGRGHGLVVAVAGSGKSNTLLQAAQRIKARTEATELPLSICYRCPTSHLDKAREIVPQIEAMPGAPAGVVAEIPYDEVSDVVRDGDLIICRLTAPLVKLCTQLLVRRVKAHVKGEDIQGKLLGIVQKVGKRRGFSFRNFTDHLAQFAVQRVRELGRRGENQGAVVNTVTR